MASSDMQAGGLLWCVHVQGPDDVVPVASYEDAVRMAEGLNWFAIATTSHPYDPMIHAVPMLWNGTAERHADYAAKLGTKGSDYGVPTEEQVEAQRKKAFAKLTEPSAELALLRTREAALVEALKRADSFITNGIELGFIRMPDPSTPDPAHETPGIVRAALNLAGAR